jgi:hypothetical protein
LKLAFLIGRSASKHLPPKGTVAIVNANSCFRQKPSQPGGTIIAAIKYDSIFCNERKSNAVAMKKYTWANRCLLSVYSYIESGQNTCFAHLYEKTIAVFSFFPFFLFFNCFYIFYCIFLCVYSASASSASSNFLRSWSFLGAEGAVGIAALVAGATVSASGVATLAGVAAALAGVKSKRFTGVL